MRFSTKSRYALRLMVELALNENDSSVSLKNISQRQDISLKYLEQIVSLMTKAGLLLSMRGAQGGYRLAKKASDMTVSDILQATEGSFAPAPCLEKGYVCNRMSQCATNDFWCDLHEHLRQYLKSITLEDLAKAQKEKRMPDYFI
ncbi:MAG: Rrf2 family transcriptional regulator [Betaproteobacteria bacterium]|nr:Rrf2 family transcriptional regulator [Betaproteobacteria bacterium]